MCNQASNPLLICTRQVAQNQCLASLGPLLHDQVHALVNLFIPHPHRRPRGTYVGYPSIVAASRLASISRQSPFFIARTPRLLLSQTLSITLLKPLYRNQRPVSVGPKSCAGSPYISQAKPAVKTVASIR